jgi:GNAT superfamily N-acetyltransferase
MGKGLKVLEIEVVLQLGVESPLSRARGRGWGRGIEMSAEIKSGVTVRHDLRPGDMGQVIALHGVLYAQEYGFDHGFEAYVAETMAEFGKLARPDLDRLWVAEREGRLVGSIAIVGRVDGAAQLRWFLVDPETRGSGLGRRLVHDALEFCRAAGYRTVYLWTVNGLDAAARLYVAAGFRKTETKPPVPLWGVNLAEERYDLDLSPR